MFLYHQLIVEQFLIECGKPKTKPINLPIKLPTQSQSVVIPKQKAK